MTRPKRFPTLPKDISASLEWFQVQGSLRTWATGFDSPADAVGYKYYIVPEDGDENPLTPPSNTVNFAAG